MKKNKMMRLASGFLILCLLTTCAISGTFAKYTTADKASDTARVAKFGVTVTTSGTLFSNAYASAEAESGANLPTAWASGENTLEKSISVATADGAANDNIVAPGTESHGDGISFGITGKPEVAVTVSAKISAQDVYLKQGTYAYVENVKSDITKDNFKAEVDKGLYAIADGVYKKIESTDSYDGDTDYYRITDAADVGADYYPVVYTMKDNADVTTASGAAKKVATNVYSADASEKTTSTAYSAVCDVSKDYDANTDLSTLNLGSANIQWKWLYEDQVSDNIATTDKKDTLLGNMIAARGETTPAYSFVVKTAEGTYAALTYGSGSDYTVSYTSGKSKIVVANLYTSFDISIDVTQID